jgi:hypothetical protein
LVATADADLICLRRSFGPISGTPGGHKEVNLRPIIRDTGEHRDQRRRMLFRMEVNIALLVVLFAIIIGLLKLWEMWRARSLRAACPASSEAAKVSAYLLLQ